MFGKLDRSQVVLVTGDQDNVYYPGYAPSGTTPIPGPAWAGIDETATGAKGAPRAGPPTRCLGAGVASYMLRKPRATPSTLSVPSAPAPVPSAR